MGECGFSSVGSYLAALECNSELKNACRRILTVSISRFFRDRRMWDYLAKEVFPTLAREHAEKIKVWSAGCASGEEVYSIAIVRERLVRERLVRDMDRPLEIEILATDLNPDYLARARAGIYNPSSLREVPAGVLSPCFEEKSESALYEVKLTLKRGILWMKHDLLTEPPARGYHLVLLRNSLLTYYEDGLKGPAFGRIVDSMKTPAFLAIGSHETLPADSAGLLRPTANPCVFVKALPETRQ
jgi:chemotaxis protein methyltransferase CheR